MSKNTDQRVVEQMVTELGKIYTMDMTEEDISKFFNSFSSDRRIVDQAMDLWIGVDTEVVEKGQRLYARRTGGRR